MLPVFYEHGMYKLVVGVALTVTRHNQVTGRNALVDYHKLKPRPDELWMETIRDMSMAAARIVPQSSGLSVGDCLHVFVKMRSDDGVREATNLFMLPTESVVFGVAVAFAKSRHQLALECLDHVYKLKTPIDIAKVYLPRLTHVATDERLHRDHRALYSAITRVLTLVDHKHIRFHIIKE